MNTQTRGVIYARYSGDKQRETSIDDQVRNCNRRAEHEGIAIREVFSDKAISGAVRARPGYLSMLDASTAGRFDVLLVDDLSRLSRDDYEMKGVLRMLMWRGVRVIGVTDGYDSTMKGHKIHAGFKGLMNEMFLDDLRERTHRGMTGQAMKGYSCGGRIFGYRSVPIHHPERKDSYGRAAVMAVRYEVLEEQAEVVRTIYGWYAEGCSYTWIAAELNRRGVRSSREGSWAASAIKVILDNPMYEGKLIWNRTRKTRHPETGRRRSRPRPREEWIIHEHGDLQIVASDVIDRVRTRQRRNRAQGLGGLTTAPAHRYLFSGLMRCGRCDGNMVLVSKNRYGCAVSKTRGPTECDNSRTVSRHIVERRLLGGIKARLLEPRYVERFKRRATELMEARNTERGLEELKRELERAERERSNLLDAIKQGIVTASTKDALESVERQIEERTRRITHARRNPVSFMLPRALERYQAAVDALESRLVQHVEPAREILRSLLGSRITLHPKDDHYVAEVPDHAAALLAVPENLSDLSGAGCPDWGESYRVCLAPTPRDSTPLAYRSGNRARKAA